MSPEEAIAEFQEYERRLASILENFSTGQNSTNIDEDDDPLYRQYVQELIDLFDDMMGQNQYSKQINSYFSDGIQNFTESPSYKSVENILGVVRAALTRMRRNRDVLRFADSFPSPPTSTSTHTLIAETGRLGVELGSPSLSVQSAPPPDPVALHHTLIARIVALEAAIAQRPSSADIGIGHNNPPGTIDDADLEASENDLAEIQVFINALKAQPPRPPVAPESLQRQTEHVGRFAQRLLGYFDTFATKASESAGTQFGKIVMSPKSWFWFSVAVAVSRVADAATTWLNALPH